jgi:hypothetical protein
MPCGGSCHRLRMPGQRLTWRTSGPCFREGKDPRVRVCVLRPTAGMAGSPHSHVARPVHLHAGLFMRVETCRATAPVLGRAFVHGCLHAVGGCVSVCDCCPCGVLVHAAIDPRSGECRAVTWQAVSAGVLGLAPACLHAWEVMARALCRDARLQGQGGLAHVCVCVCGATGTES